MKRIFVLLMVLVFMSATAEAIVFKKGDKVVDKQTGELYEFRYNADIGIYSADSGLGDLFIVDGKVYAITPQGVMGMKAVSERTDVRAELKTALKRYRSKKAETARAWKALATEKGRVKLLREANGSYRKSAEYYELAVKELQDKQVALKEEVVELEQWGQLASGALNESKDALTTTRGFLDAQEKKHNLLNIYITILFCMVPVAFGAGICYKTYALRKKAEPIEEMEVIDLTDLA